MKRVIGFALLIIELQLFGIQGIAATPSVNNEFGLRFYSNLTRFSENKNIIFSPYSLKQALGMAATGARGRTSKQLGRPPDPWLSRKDPSYRLLLGSRLWIQSGYVMTHSFMTNFESNFGVVPWIVDFTKAPDFLRDRVNGWLTERTQGKLRDIITEDSVNPGMKMILTSALSFSGRWVSTFEVGETREGDFFTEPGKAVRVPFVNKRGEFNTFQNSELQVLEMPYLDGEISMVYILPQSASRMESIERSLHAEILDQWLSGMSKKEVRIRIPKFDLESNYDLTEGLKTLGVTDPFDPSEADFSGITGKKELYLDRVYHKTRISFSETGTEVVSSTGATSRNIASSSVEFNANHPGIVIIRNRISKEILLIARIKVL